MAREQYIAGLDIGTHTIRVAQGKIEDSGRLNIIGAASVPAVGMRRGVIVDIDEAVSSISAVLEKVERMTGVSVNSANVSVSGNHIVSLHSKGVIAVSRADNEIAESDIVRVVDASQAVSIPPNREVIHVVPKTYTLDGQEGIKDPMGMTGIRLEVETVIIHGATPFLKNVSRAIAQAGLKVDQFVVSSLACSESVLNKRQKELGVALIDLGAGTTSVAVYEEGNLLHTAVVPIGSAHITQDLSVGLRCQNEVAEKVKLMYAKSSPALVDKLAEIDMSKLDSDSDAMIPQKLVAEITEARLEEIFDMVIKELKMIDRDGKLPAGVVLTGGGSHLPGIVEFTKHYLRLPVLIGVPNEVDTIIDQVIDPSFATVIGLTMWDSDAIAQSSSFKMGNPVRGLLENKNVVKLKKWFKTILP